jgi:hypothetical protein
MLSSKSISEHAEKRMHHAGVNINDINFVLSNGRMKHSKGCVYYFLGKKETQKSQKKLNGLHVLMSSDQKTIITVYKNRRPSW